VAPFPYLMWGVIFHCLRRFFFFLFSKPSRIPLPSLIKNKSKTGANRAKTSINYLMVT
jgi:hypothetical protein